jgi:hypothetical protein
MKWSEFQDKVRVNLLVDADRKGRGIQKYINQLMVSAVVNLQDYIDAFKARNVNTFFASDMLPVPTGNNSSEVQFTPTHATIDSVVVSGLKGDDDSQRWFSYVEIVPWGSRFRVIDGCPTRNSGYAGRVTFGDGKLYLCSPLVDDQKLYIYWTGIKQSYDPDDLVIYDDSSAKAVADYIKAHLNREVDKDVGLYKSYIDMYNKQRQELHRVWKDFNHTTAIDHAQSQSTGIGSGGFTIG